MNPLRRLRRALDARGTLVIVGGRATRGSPVGSDVRRAPMMLSPFVSQRLTAFMSKEDHGTIDKLAEMLSSGAVVPAIDRVVALEDVPAAMADLENGRCGARSRYASAVRTSPQVTRGRISAPTTCMNASGSGSSPAGCRTTASAPAATQRRTPSATCSARPATPVLPAGSKPHCRSSACRRSSAPGPNAVGDVDHDVVVSGTSGRRPALVDACPGATHSDPGWCRRSGSSHLPPHRSALMCADPRRRPEGRGVRRWPVEADGVERHVAARDRHLARRRASPAGPWRTHAAGSGARRAGLRPDPSTSGRRARCRGPLGPGTSVRAWPSPWP
jgi:hypothetical protein